METLEWIKIIIGSAFLLCGVVIFFTEIFGVFHFHYVLNRMHAAAMGDTLGITSCLIGLMIFSGLNYTTLKILLIIIFLWFASPVSSHVLARLEATTNENLSERCEIYEDLDVLEQELAGRNMTKDVKEEASDLSKRQQQLEQHPQPGAAPGQRRGNQNADDEH